MPSVKQVALDASHPILLYSDGSMKRRQMTGAGQETEWIDIEAPEGERVVQVAVNAGHVVAVCATGAVFEQHQQSYRRELAWRRVEVP